MTIKHIQPISAEEENFRLEPSGQGFATVRRNSIEPVPVGTYVAQVFRVTGYDRDCDGSLMARLASVDSGGRETGWTARAIGLYPDCTVALDGPGDLHALATEELKRTP